MKLKHIGIVGITAEGAALCYKTIVSEGDRILGSQVHPEISLHNFSLSEYNPHIKNKEWDIVADMIGASMRKLVSIGAEVIIMPSNAPHYAQDLFIPKCTVPYLSIVDETVNECKEQGYKKVAVLGIGLTMTDGLYETPLKANGMEPMIPEKGDQDIMNDVIFNNIVPAKVTAESTQKIVDIIAKLKTQGAEAVILGCTELPIVIDESNSPLPFVDTTRLIAKKALAFAMKEN